MEKYNTIKKGIKIYEENIDEIITLKKNPFMNISNKEDRLIKLRTTYKKLNTLKNRLNKLKNKNFEIQNMN